MNLQNDSVYNDRVENVVDSGFADMDVWCTIGQEPNSYFTAVRRLISQHNMSPRNIPYTKHFSFSFFVIFKVYKQGLKNLTRSMFNFPDNCPPAMPTFLK